MKNLPTIVLDLVQLESQDSETMCITLLKSLNNAGFDKRYMQNHLFSFYSNGASVMLGKTSGVGTKMKRDFPNIVIWHCLNHRLQHVLDDFIKDIKQVKHFKIFLDQIYKIFHQSNKN